MEAYVRARLARWVEANHHKIGVLIQENVERFDNETLIHLMEDKVGKDLQWIRVNGAICGFLIGCRSKGFAGWCRTHKLETQEKGSLLGFPCSCVFCCSFSDTAGPLPLYASPSSNPTAAGYPLQAILNPTLVRIKEGGA
ncbi:DUF445 family protein [Paenibacillus sp. GD4]|uniref:DUF445 family protein n=1 Tax=Paenibacillus sp. GD4 TaxID=3068890 RepID=UPI0027965817|nr:DUF445 family protein [Paenibacillus sp. GD4]MDQ1911538.1 DUF445 family protein [Paenibacillus sp. GD4]